MHTNTSTHASHEGTGIADYTRTDATLPATLDALVGGLNGQRDAMARIFGDLARLVEHTAQVEEHLLEDCAPAEVLAILAVARAEAGSLVAFIREQATLLERTDPSLSDALDGVTYALRHELRRVFEDELVGLATLKSPATVRVQLARANDLLRNCFQQTTITLAQVFDPSLDGCRIFDKYRDDRLEQSLALTKELWVLVQRIRRAMREHDCESIVAFVEGLNRFRHGRMHHLMYRDWHAFEAYVSRVLVTRSTDELLPVLGEFSVYLETLLGHVRRRAVLLNGDDQSAAPE